MLKLSSKLISIMTCLSLLGVVPAIFSKNSFAAGNDNKASIGDKERRITEGGKLAIEAEKQKKKPPAFEFPSAIELYSDDELNELISANKHLQRVKADDCQLVDDIRARAELVKLPSYEFLWGDMLAWGVCVKPNVELGLYYMRAAAFQGQPRALEQLGRYYVQGQFVQQDANRAIPLFIQSAKLGFLPAKIQLAELLVSGHGSPYDYQQTYTYLYDSVIGNAETHVKVTHLLMQLEKLMPNSAVVAAKKAAKYN